MATRLCKKQSAHNRRERSLERAGAFRMIGIIPIEWRGHVAFSHSR
jgi:hypothetical protein